MEADRSDEHTHGDMVRGFAKKKRADTRLHFIFKNL